MQARMSRDWRDCEIGEVKLPDFNMASEIRGGRVPRDGYERGIGLQFLSLQREIAADPLYQAANSLISGRTIQSDLNRMNIYLLIRFYLSRIAPGAIVEFGSYKGGSAIFMAAMAKRFLSGVQVLAFDTFEGMPPTDHAIDSHRAGDFGDVNLDELRDYTARCGLDNLHFIQGRFENTARPTIDRFESIALCHVDCDTRSGVEFSYNVTKPYMVRGAYWVFDDPLASTCLGATEAVEDILIRRDGLSSEQVFPHLVFRAALETKPSFKEVLFKKLGILSREGGSAKGQT